MGYRDEGEAALHRVASLEQDLAEERARAEEEAGQVAALQEKLAQANAEIVRLRGNPVVAPGASGEPKPGRANVWIVRALAGLAGPSLVVLGAAAYGSERDGVAVSMIALPLWGALLGAWLGRTRTTVRCVAGALGAGALTFMLLGMFFATLWRAL